VESYKISPYVENGVATLEGTVDAWLASSEAEQVAKQAGAREAQNNLQLRQSSDFSKATIPDDETR
jgi:osmotically-inducible protein OsmY